MKPIVTWVLVADLASARILVNTDIDEGLLQQPNHVFKVSEILPYSDDEGRAMAGSTSARVRLDKHVEYTPESDAFARHLIEVLTVGKRDKAYDRLIICAGPSMLGLLRNRMPDALTDMVKSEIAKDFVNMPNSKIYQQLGAVNLVKN